MRLRNEISIQFNKPICIRLSALIPQLCAVPLSIPGLKCAMHETNIIIHILTKTNQRIQRHRTLFVCVWSTHRPRQCVGGVLAGHVLALEALELEAVGAVQLVVVDTAAIAAQAPRDDVRVVGPAVRSK